MIIVRTDNGDMFVNENELKSLQHNRETHTVTMEWKNNPAFRIPLMPITQVNAVVYLNKEQPVQWCDEGVAVKYLQKSIESYKTELSCRKEIIDELKSRLRSLGHDCVQWVEYYHNDMPDNLREQMRDRGEAAKAYVNHGEDEMYKRNYMQTHKPPKEIEDDAVLKLSHQIEEMDCELRNKDAEIRGLDNRVKSAEKWAKAHRETNERLMQRNLWERIINKEVYVYPDE